MTGRPMDYRIRINGQLDPRWADWFAGMAITLDGVALAVAKGERRGCEPFRLGHGQHGGGIEAAAEKDYGRFHSDEPQFPTNR